MKPAKARYLFKILGGVILAVCLLFVTGVLSTPRDFSSPETVIRLVDVNGSPLPGVEVGRNWYDSDIGKDGSEHTMSDESGIAKFSKVPARVGLFTGTWTKAYRAFGMCGLASGTTTSIYVRYHGLCTVVPKGKSLRKLGQSNRDPDGVWFDAQTDSQGNTLVKLSFPKKTKNIDYVLSAKPPGQ